MYRQRGERMIDLEEEKSIWGNRDMTRAYRPDSYSCLRREILTIQSWNGVGSAALTTSRTLPGSKLNDVK
jgi:hypothetical protein